ncbi:unnamed protein product [Rotaria sordida]|uniref:FAD-binding domain-containing protein n=1 Tax=Rotaria sordida TaxID=392033 RepID=A0A818WW74_9BILA|nr:unnamed protein product [Rotaria sordida]CAF3731560.1 unnamed protein product [Rotaria sordida]
MASIEQSDLKTNQQQLVALIDSQSLEDFIKLYRESLSTLKEYDHVELLLRASRYGLLPFVRNILNDSSALVDTNCRHSSTYVSPLVVAIRAQKHDVINYLIQEAKADVNWSCDEKNTTCLHEAIRRHDLSTAKLLLQYGAIVDKRHLQIAMIECLSQKDTETSPIALFDMLVDHHPDLLDDISRKTALEFVIRRTRWSSPYPYHHLAPLLERLVSDENCQSITHLPILSTIEPTKITTSSNIHRTQVGIIGGGPAGLMLGALLSRSGIDSIVLERHSRSYVESNIRAGLLEQATIDALNEIGAGERLLQEGFIQRNIHMQFDGERITIPLRELTQGKVATIYGQHFVLQDLIDQRIKSGRRLWFDIESVEIERHDIADDGSSPSIRFIRCGSSKEEFILCDFIAGCDGVLSTCCRRSVPPGILHTIQRVYPFAWLSLLVEALPSGKELIYSTNSTYGFALQSLRSSTHTRFHLQVPLNDTLADWPDKRIWNELKLRLKPNNLSWTLNEGPIVERALFPIHASVTTPMQYKRLFFAGDAVHIFPPTGAKGLNIAVKDVQVLAHAFEDYYDNDQLDKVNNYTTSCLPHIWQAQEFGIYMTSLLHKMDISKDYNCDNDDLMEFNKQLQRVQQQSLQNSKTLQQHLAEMYVQ